MTEILAQIFKKCNSEEIDKACYLSLGILAPKFANLEFNLAEKMIIRVISQTTNKPIDEIITFFKQTGDLGETIFQIQSKNDQENIEKIPLTKGDGREERAARGFNNETKDSTNNLTLSQVYSKLKSLALDSGTGSVDRKVQAMVNLLKQLDPLSAKFLVRIPIKKLRLGFSDMTIIDALSWSVTGDKSLRKPIEAAFNVRADIGQVAKLFKQQGIEGIEKVIPVPGTPLRPAKATPLLDPDDILEKMSHKSALEAKYDGFRVQIHLDKSRHMPDKNADGLFVSDAKPYVQIFSRNLDNITHMFPELVSATQNLPVDSVIIDGEAVATDPVTGKMLDFQETIKRKRKHNIEEVAAQIPLTAYIFDIMLQNGKSLISLPLTKRRLELEKIFTKSQSRNDTKNPLYERGQARGTSNQGIKKGSNSLQLTSQTIVTKLKEFNQFFHQMATGGLEGLMAKKLDSPYRAGARDFTWVKYKVGMQSDMADTVDVIIMGYFKGQGKWTKFGLGKLLVGIPENGDIISLSKVGSGLSEENIKELVTRLDKIQTKEKPKNYKVDKNLIPDVWVEPTQVIELRADSISTSKVYQTGFSLRFPRFIKFRDDKSPEDATSLKQLTQFAGQS